MTISRSNLTTKNRKIDKKTLGKGGKSSILYDFGRQEPLCMESTEDRVVD